jgi:hypothetical protein
LVDPTNETILEGVYKKDIREGEERLMLAVLESAVEDFQKYVLARHARGKKLFQEAEEWLLDKDSDVLFSFGEHLPDPRTASRAHTEGLDDLEGSPAQNAFV